MPRQGRRITIRARFRHRINWRTTESCRSKNWRLSRTLTLHLDLIVMIMILAPFRNSLQGLMKKLKRWKSWMKLSQTILLFKNHRTLNLNRSCKIFICHQLSLQSPKHKDLQDLATNMAARRISSLTPAQILRAKRKTNIQCRMIQRKMKGIKVNILKIRTKTTAAKWFMKTIKIHIANRVGKNTTKRMKTMTIKTKQKQPKTFLQTWNYKETKKGIYHNRVLWPTLSHRAKMKTIRSNFRRLMK